jgi:hypothetical protein
MIAVRKIQTRKNDMIGKTAMVWQLRMWQGGVPEDQVAQCKELGLNGVLLKIVDGKSLVWGGSPTNYDLLPATIEALRDAGIKVGGWGYTYGGRWIAGVFFPSESIAREEGKQHALACSMYGIKEFWIDAEGEYDRSGMNKHAEAYMIGFESDLLPPKHYLCSYRFPKTYQPDFPVEAFEPYMEGWAPQVYFLGDNRPDGGARQLQTSFYQYQEINPLPFVPVAPTYLWNDVWRASYAQLMAFFQEAKDVGCEGVSVWDLPQASAEQLKAIKDFEWEVVSPPPSGDCPDWVAADIRASAGAIAEQSDLMYDLADQVENL